MSTDATNIEWLNGIAVFIDDEINDEKSNAYKLKQQIDDNKIPVLTRLDLPDDVATFANHIHGASFVIVDWKFSNLGEEIIAEGGRLPENVKEKDEEVIINFIRQLLTNTYCPIFIFSNEGTSDIKKSLDSAGITNIDQHPRIFVATKTDLLDGKLFDEIHRWFTKNPIVYTLKTWDTAAKKAKKQIFTDLENKHISWPLVLWKSFKSDGGVPSIELSQILSALFSNTVIHSCDFEEQYLNADNATPLDQQDIRKVLEGTRFVSLDTATKPAPGDLFGTTDSQGSWTYYVNIRAQCSTLRDKNPCLYCIKGKEVPNDRLNADDISFKNGELLSKKHFIYVPFVHENRILEFDCRKFLILRYESSTATIKTVANPPSLCQINAIRIGRILPPYITNIQQILSSFIVREGVPAIPAEAIPQTAQED